MTLTESEKLEAIDAAQAAGFKVETGQKVKGPEKIEQVPEPEPAATHETVAPVPEKQNVKAVPEPTSKGTRVELWGNMAMMVHPEAQGTFPIEFLKADRRVCIETPKSPPWLSPRLQDRLVAKLIEALGDDGRPPTFMRRKVGEAFANIKTRLETDDGVKKAMTPEPVRRMIEKTESVIVYPGEVTLYKVTIEGRLLTITATQMARIDPGFVNVAILNAFPLDPLDASKNDWKAIKDYWLSPDVAEVREVEEVTEAEAVIDRLAEDLTQVILVNKAEDMTGPDYAWFDEKKGVIWVHGRRIARFLDELKRPGWNDGKLSATLQQAEYTFTRTGKPRIGREGKDGKQTRCWPFKPGVITFHPPVERPQEMRDYVDQ